MTISIERTRSVINTREFLFRLINSKETPRVPRYIRENARALLRHYPSKSDLINLNHGHNVFGEVDEQDCNK